MDYERILLFSSSLLIENKYGIRQHEIEGVFEAICNELNRYEFDLDKLDYITYQHNMDCFSEMNEISKKSVAELLVNLGIKEEYCSYFLKNITGINELISCVGDISVEFWKRFKNELIPIFLAENNRFLSNIDKVRLSESVIRDLDNFFDDFCVKGYIWYHICYSQKLSEEFLIEYVRYVSENPLIVNRNIPEDVKQRILDLKKVLEQ